MWQKVFWLSACALLARGDEFTGRAISEVAGAPASLDLETRAGDRYDPAKVRHDIHALYDTGHVSDVKAEAAPDGDRVRITFLLRPKQTVRVRKVQFVPPTAGVKVQIEPGAELDEQAAQQVAAGVRKQLTASGYSDAKVEARLAPTGPGTADLQIVIDKRKPVDVGGVTVSGHLGVKPSEVRHALHATQSKRMLPGIPGIWNGWRIRPAYHEDAVQADLARLRSFYYRRGFFDADVRVDSVDFSAGQARVAYFVESGPQFHIQSLNRMGPGPRKSEIPVEAVCRDLYAQQRAAERKGILDFSPRLEIEGEGPAVSATTSVTTGPAYRVGRIDFRGNHSFGDVSIRRALLLDEGAPLDQMLLRKSLERINRTGWFEPLTERSVIVNTPPGSDRAHVIIALKEKKSRHWSFSGPVGSMNVGGPLRFDLGSRLPAWGRGIYELSTYTVSINLMLFAKPIGTLIPFLPNKRFIQIFTIDRPLIPGQRWLSGFTIAPQFGWEGIVAGYAVSQLHTLVQGALQTDRALMPALPVTVAHDGHEGTLPCEPPRAPFDRVRQASDTAVNLLFSFVPF